MADKKAEDTPLLVSEEESLWDTVTNPVKHTKSFVDSIFTNFGYQFAMLLGSSYVGVKGFVYTMVSIGQVPYYKDYLGLPASRYQVLKTVAGTPWATKALLGALSDSMPLFGYHKRWYMILATMIGTAALIVVAGLPKSSNGEVAAAMFFLINLFVAVTDLLCEGKYAEKMRENPHTGSDLVSWVWGLVQLGGLLGSCIAGPVAESGHVKVIFWICVPFALQLLFPLLFGWLPEVKVPEGQRGLNTAKFKQRPQLFMLGFFVAGGAIFLAIVGEFGTQLIQLSSSIAVSVVACILAHMWLPTILARANLYMFLSQVLYIDTSGAMTYFFLATPEQYPNGPHFSNIYYFTYTAIVGSIAGFLGVTLFQSVLSKGNFRTAFWVTTVVQCVASLIDVCLVERWNIAIGIPDKAFYMLGDAMIGGVIGMLNFMPAVVLTSKVCPKGVESLVYALLAGFQNFGSTVGSYMGAYITNIAGIKTNASQLPWNFDNLTMLLVIGHFLVPLLAVPLTFILIPDAKMSDEFDTSEIACPGEGDIDVSPDESGVGTARPDQVVPTEA